VELLSLFNAIYGKLALFKVEGHKAGISISVCLWHGIWLITQEWNITESSDFVELFVVARVLVVAILGQKSKVKFTVCETP